MDYVQLSVEIGKHETLTEAPERGNKPEKNSFQFELLLHHRSQLFFRFMAPVRFRLAAAPLVFLHTSWVTCTQVLNYAADVHPCFTTHHYLVLQCFFFFLFL